MPNHLLYETSPYLLQHALNPVDWYPWSPEALEKARSEDKPIFLSIGYAACHWCHVMAHESFEDPATAELMNAHFVSIKVDREERPDLDSIYMSFVVALTGQGGWPTSVFLTPEGIPFFGGTYFPPERRHNLPAFREVLDAIARLWKGDRSQLLSGSLDLVTRLQDQAQAHAHGQSLNHEVLEHAARLIAENYDWEHGGWGGAPKFPQPMLIEFLLRHAAAGDHTSLEPALHALRAMAKGGMYDLIGGGFARYSVDATWRIPHFEKMLYDNAQLARAYLHAYQLTHDDNFRTVCEATLEFVLRELTHPQGGFFSSLDADSEGEEGKYYLWTKEEILSTFTDPLESALVLSAFNITEQGNFGGKNILQRSLSAADLPGRFNLSTEELNKKLIHLQRRLLEIRSQRVRPTTDDKVLVSWNALMMTAFAEAGRSLGRQDYLEAAIRNANFLLDHLMVDGRLLRSWREGVPRHNAYLEDYAGLALALLVLYQSDPLPRWYQAAIGLIQDMLPGFTDPSGGFFDTRADHEKLLYRPKEIQDNATPSGSALAATVLLELAAYEDREDWRDLAQKLISSNLGVISRYPTAFAQWLCAADFALNPVRQVAIVGELSDPATQALLQALRRGFFPNLVLAASSYPPPDGSPALLNDRPLLDSKPTAYVCQGFVCLLPVNDPEQMLAQLSLQS